MILLDTDHLTILKYPANPRCTSLIARLEASQDEEIGTTIISVEEQWRGWLSVTSSTCHGAGDVCLRGNGETRRGGP
jgi:hypothetical protein